MFKSKSAQELGLPVCIKGTTTSQPHSTKEYNEQSQEQDGQDGGQGETKVKRVTGGGNRHWPGLVGRKPQDSEDHVLRKLHVSHLNMETDRAAMHSYFKKFGAVERCYRTTKEKTNEKQEYGFVVFKTAATADEVQRARSHTLRGG